MSDVNKRAGWYPDPDNGAGERWWNGAGWSDTRRAGAGAAASSPYGPASAAPIPMAPVEPAPLTPVPIPPAPASVTSTPPIVYSASNPAPQRPDPYAPLPGSTAGRASSINVSVNRNAMIGFVTGLVSLFANVLYVLAPIAIIFSAMGLTKARQLKAQGVTSNLMVFAVVGLVAGGIAAFISLVSIVVFFVSVLTDVGS